MHWYAKHVYVEEGNFGAPISEAIIYPFLY